MKTTNAVEKRMIRGGREFLHVYGVCENTQSKMRSQGLKCYHNGKYYFYYVRDIDEFIENNWRVLVPAITNKTTQQ